MASREKDQSDYDLENFIELFDMALISNDSRIKKALGHLLTITTLITSEKNKHDVKTGPLRRLFENFSDINTRVSKLENSLLNHNLGKHNTNPILDQKYSSNFGNSLYYPVKHSTNTSGDDC